MFLRVSCLTADFTRLYGQLRAGFRGVRVSGCAFWTYRTKDRELQLRWFQGRGLGVLGSPKP